MRKIISIFLFCVFIQIAQAAEKKSYYTLQFGTFPLTAQKQALTLYKTLKEAGHLVYYQTDSFNGKEELKVRVGIFSDRTQTQKISKKLESPYTVEKTRLFVDHAKQFRIVTTPSAIWYDAENSTKELYVFEGIHGADLLEQTYALLSPTGKDIIFYYDGKIIKVDVGTGKSRTLVKEGLFDSRPVWSYDGRYIAYLDNTEWETPTSLCIIEAEKNHCLIKNNETTQKAVKSFQWYPGKNRLFFVEGHAYGTVSVGGSLYMVDMEGKRKDVVLQEEGKFEEIHAEFSIHEGLLSYQVVQFDKEYTKSLSSTTRKIRVDN